MMDHHHHQQRRDASNSLDSGAANQDDDDQLDANNRTTETQTMMHILKANIGTGVLAMPLAFKNVGLWLGLWLVPLIGIICIHCMNILITSHNHLCDRFNYESLDYDQVAALGLACGPKWARRLSKRASIIVTIFLMFTQLGFCCVYILFTVENLQVACMNLFQLNYSMLTYLLAVFPIIGLTSCTSNLKHLARISTLANILQLAGLALIFFDLLQFHTYASGQVDDATANQVAGVSGGSEPRIVVQQGVNSNLLSGLPLFFATAVYAFEGIGVVLPLVKEMKHPSRISGPNGVLNTSMSMVALLYMAMGFFGYTKYGQTVAGSITLNLPQTTLNELVRLAFAIAIGLSYSLQFYVPWTIVWPFIDEGLFYSYRPRVSRNKLSILDELSAENHWAIQKVLEEKQQLQQQQHEQTRSRDGASVDDQWLQYEDNSMASTLATSYSMSLSVRPGQFQVPPQPATALVHQSRQLLNQQQAQRSMEVSATKSMSLSNQLSLGSAPSKPTAGHQYGALAAGLEQNFERPVVGLGGSGGGIQKPPAASTGRLRNRLEDVMEQSSDEMPEVQWRPPPRSMRGKRKLVRYTVILLTVSFTFVAAALIPRLDLFISLIGALASSSLAIIFPAIIQLCTFWNSGGPHANNNSDDDAAARHHQTDDDDDEQENEGKSNEQQQPGSSSAAACCFCRQNRPSSRKLEASLQPLLPDCRACKRRRRRRWQNSIAWHLFVLKNMLLVLFGVLGLITGTWVSLNQLSATNSESV